MFRLYGLLIGIGVLVGTAVSTLQAKRWGKDPKLIEDSLFWIFIPAVVGARLYHVITDWSLYADASFLEIIAVWNGGLGYFGALFGGILGLIAFSRFSAVQKISKTKFQNQNKNTATFFTLLDLLAFGAPLAQAIGRFGNYFNKELYGLLTTLPWAITIDGQKYHPLFLYEALLNILVFLLLNGLALKKKLPVGKGQYACLYLASYGVIRFWLEFLRPETARLSGSLGFFSIAQWVSLGISVGALAIFWLRRHSDRGVEWELGKIL